MRLLGITLPILEILQVGHGRNKQLYLLSRAVIVKEHTQVALTVIGSLCWRLEGLDQDADILCVDIMQRPWT